MYIMPLMFGFFALSFASGLSIYFIGSNIIGIGQYALMGKINFKQVLGLATAEDEADQPAKSAKPEVTALAEKPKRSEVSAPAPKAKRGKPRRDGIYDSRAQHAKAKSRSKG
jgi:YidC/Oxa1 family membrane protein insertase